MNRAAYPSDSSDAEWERLAPLLPPGPPAGHVGRPRAVDLREVVNAIRYVTREGRTWRALPHDLPKWQTAYWYLRKWLDDGVWEAVADALRGDLRVREGRGREPTAAVIDSQSVKTTDRGAGRATTPARRRTAASATSSSTRSACSSACSRTPPTCRTGTARGDWRR